MFKKGGKAYRQANSRFNLEACFSHNPGPVARGVAFITAQLTVKLNPFIH